MTYSPRPNSIAARTIELLQREPNGFEITSSDIASRLCVDGGAIAASLDQAHMQGALKRRKDGKRCWWSLGEGVPKPSAPKPRPHSGAAVKPPLPHKHGAPVAPDDPRIPRVDPNWKPLQMVCVREGADVRLPSRAPRETVEPKPETKAAPGETQDDASMLQLRPPEALTVERYVEAIGVDDEQQDAAALPFNACRYLDGSLVVVGMTVREDGAIVFTPKQAREVWKLGAAA